MPGSVVTIIVSLNWLMTRMAYTTPYHQEFLLKTSVILLILNANSFEELATHTVTVGRI